MEIITGQHTDKGELESHRFRNSRFERPEHAQPIYNAPTVIGFDLERRRVTTQRKKRSTNAHWTIGRETRDPLTSLRKLGGGGGLQSKVERALYDHQVQLLEEQERRKNQPKPPPTDDIPF